MQNILKVTSLSTAYGSKKILEDISFEINRGEILGIVGESGSGKTTIFNSLLGLKPELKILSGDIEFKDKNMLKLSPNEKRKILGKEIGTVFQNSSTSLVATRKIKSQFEETVKNKINITKSQIKKDALELFNLLSLENPDLIYNSYPFELSGGMQQRVALALSLILKPELLLCDEPTSALDVRVEYDLVKELSRLRKEKNLAILIITHNLALAKKLCDKIMVVYGGRIMEYRQTKSLIENPLHPYTNNLINAIPKLLEKNKEIVKDVEGLEDLYCKNCQLIHAGGHDWEKVSIANETED